MSASPVTTAIALAPAEPSRTASASSALATTTATYGLRLREVTSRGRERPICGTTGCRIGGEDQVERRKADRTGGEMVGVPQRDVHCPVGAARLAELAGAIERIDDPDPVGAEATRVLEAFLRQHRVVGPGDRPVPAAMKRWLARSPASITCHAGAPARVISLADLHQQVAGFDGQPGGRAASLSTSRLVSSLAVTASARIRRVAPRAPACGRRSRRRPARPGWRT